MKAHVLKTQTEMFLNIYTYSRFVKVENPQWNKQLYWKTRWQCCLRPLKEHRLHWSPSPGTDDGEPTESDLTRLRETE